MARRLEQRSPSGGTTDHAPEVHLLRQLADSPQNDTVRRLTLLTAADLLEAHDQTGISLDNWSSARSLVETLLGFEIIENGV